MQVLDNSDTKIKEIIHVSDLHIRLLKRHDEYKEVFTKFYSKLEELVTKNVCLVITGDIFHTKTTLSAEAVDLCSEFFKRCADILPTIVIPGNHDFIMSNRNRLDNISPIINALNHNNIFFLKESGLYKFRNILFNHFSAFDENEQEKYTLYKDIPEKEKYLNDYIIGICHGALNSAFNSAGYEFNHRNLNPEIFDGHHIVLLGDIHKQQVIQEYDKKNKKPLIIYSGSLIQQDHGEPLENHGIVYWKLDTTPTAEFIDIKNDYGFFSIQVESGKLVTEFPIGLPKNLRLRTLCCDTLPSQLKDVISDLKEKYNIVEVSYIHADCNKNISHALKTNDFNIFNILDIDYQNNLIDKFLKSKQVDQRIIDKVKKLNETTNAKILKEKKINNIRWKPKKFEFDNMFSYGEGNVVDFTKLKGIVGLFAKNASGKCVRKDTKIDIEFNKEEIIKKLGHFPKKLTNETTIETVYNIFKKYGDINLSVKTPFGYRHIEACDITEKNSVVVKVTLSNGMTLFASPKHKLKINSSIFVEIENLKVNDIIQTSSGNSKIKEIKVLNHREDLYDIQVEKVKQYYSNGIVSHNSSVLEALTFCVFDKFSKGNKASDIINNQKDGFRCKFNFEIGGVDYFIERSGNFTKKGNVPVAVKFYKIVNNTEVPLNGEMRRLTNDIIRDYLGNYEDFILTVLSIQNNKLGSFIDLTQSERKDMICQFMGLTIYDQLLEITTEEFKETNVLMKTMDLVELDSKKDVFNTKINESKKSLNELTTLLKNTTDYCNTLNEKVIELVKSIDKSAQFSYNITDLNSKKIQCETDINNINTTIQNLKNTETNLSNEIEELENKYNSLLQSHNITNVDSIYSEYSKIDSQLKDKKMEIDILKNLVKHKLDKINRLKNHKYNPDCEYCVNNEFVQDALKAKEELDDDKLKSDNLLIEYTNIENNLKQYTNILKVCEEYKSVVRIKENKEKEKLKTSNAILINENKHSDANNQLKSIVEKIEDYHLKESIIKSNNKINENINNVNVEIKEIKNQMYEINSNIVKLSTEIGQYELQLKLVNDEINKYKELETTFHAYNNYLLCINRDGIPYELIQTAIPTLENEINNILRQIVEFTVSLQTDGKNIITNIVYDDRSWALEMSSGMEKFISSLAIRIALTNISNLPRPNMLCIDEGFGCVDTDHLDQMGGLFAYLKNQFDFIWIISHLEQLKDIVDIQVEIEKENGFSKIYV